MEGTRSDPARRPVPRLVTGVLAAVFLLAGWIATSFASQPILEHHAFRQTQTALTAYWLVRNGPALRYETPVLGAPWSIPFELPIYQGVVAAVHAVTGAPLDPLGRLTSFAFLLACIYQAAALLGKLRFPRSTACIFAALTLASPQYLLWGRSFMMETAALFFTMAATRYFFAYDDGEKVSDLALFTLMMTLALLQKVTTAFPVLVGLGLYWLYRQKARGAVTPATLREAVSFLLCGLATAAWTSYAGAVRSLNAYGALLSSERLRQWVFGTLDDRWSRELWVTTFFERQLVQNLGGVLGIGLLVWSLATSRKRTRVAVSACLLVFFASLLIFSNVHIVHDYYQTSITVWLLLAAAISLSHLFEVRRLYGAVLFVSLVLSNVAMFVNGDFDKVRAQLTEENMRTLAIAAEVRRTTAEDAKILVYGYDWSAEVAYYSRRKALMLEPWPLATDDVLADPARFLGEAPGAVVLCPGASPRIPDAGRLLRQLGDGYFREQVAGCDLLMARPRA